MSSSWCDECPVPGDLQKNERRAVFLPPKNSLLVPTVKPTVMVKKNDVIYNSSSSSPTEKKGDLSEIDEEMLLRDDNILTLSKKQAIEVLITTTNTQLWRHILDRTLKHFFYIFGVSLSLSSQPAFIKKKCLECHRNFSRRDS
jgi:hypothetical protein